MNKFILHSSYELSVSKIQCIDFMNAVFRINKCLNGSSKKILRRWPISLLITWFHSYWLDFLGYTSSILFICIQIQLQSPHMNLYWSDIVIICSKNVVSVNINNSEVLSSRQYAVWDLLEALNIMTIISYL